jgi:hypothetical protein
VLLPGNIYGTACALDDEGPHVKAVVLQGFMLRAASHYGIWVAPNVQQPGGRSENVVTSVHVYDDFAWLPWTSAASFRIS